MWGTHQVKLAIDIFYASTCHSEVSTDCTV